MGKRAVYVAGFWLVFACTWYVEDVGAKGGKGGVVEGICKKRPNSRECYCKKHPKKCSKGGGGEVSDGQALTPGQIADLIAAQAAATAAAAEAAAEAAAAAVNAATSREAEAAAIAAYEEAAATATEARAAADRAEAAAAAAAAAANQPPATSRVDRAPMSQPADRPKGAAGGTLDNRAYKPAAASDPNQRQQVAGYARGTKLTTDVKDFSGRSRFSGGQSADYARGAKMKMRMKDYSGALEDSNRAVAADPANAEGYVRRAEVNSLLKRYDDAERDALYATKLDPDYANSWQNLAWVRMKQKRFREAEEAATRAIALNPNDATSRAIRAYARDVLGDRAGALSDLEAAASLDPRFRDKLAEARGGGKIYDPDQDSELAFAVATAAGKKPAWRLVVVWAGGGLLVAGAAAVFLHRRKRRPSFGFRGSAAEKRADGRLGGKYEVLNVIGRGGMGTIYAATDHTLGRPVAIKKVSEELTNGSPRAREMLVKEARTVASLHHSAIVEIYEIVEEGQDLYVVFELLTGKTAAQILAENGKLNLTKCLDVLKPVGEALDFAHGRSLVHRDLKPANIMVTEHGQVKLMDFGIARSVADAVPADGAAAQTSSAWQARTGTVVGTPAYMAPEAAVGLVSKATDIYALGVCLYELSTGHRPFPDSERLSAPITPPSALDPALAVLDALVLAALDPEPARRPRSAGAFIAALAAAVRPDGG